LKTQQTRRNTQGGPGGAKGARESNRQGVPCTPAFLFFFFVSTDIPPPLLAPPPPPLPPSRNMKNTPFRVRSLCFVFRRHPHPIPSSPSHHHKTRKTRLKWCVFRVLCFGAIPFQPDTRNTPRMGVFHVSGCSSATPNLRTRKTHHFGRIFGVRHLPPSAFKHQKCARLGTFSVFDHLQPPFLVFHPPPFPPHSFLALPHPFLPIFSFLGTFYLGNYHFRYFPFK